MTQTKNYIRDEDLRVTTTHSFTARMCAASRYLESQRNDSLFKDPLAKIFAGKEGMSNPMGEWIMIPRTRYGDDLVRERGYKMFGIRQLVILGAGMDSRAWRLENVEELKVFEVDQKTNFDVKEELIRRNTDGDSNGNSQSDLFKLKVKSRIVIATDFSDAESVSNESDLPRWAKDLEANGFNRKEPSIWLLEGLMMYLTTTEQIKVIDTIGKLTPGENNANGNITTNTVTSKSIVFHDAISKSYEQIGINVGGAPFKSGSDEYLEMWSKYGHGFSAGDGSNGKSGSRIVSIDDMFVDRRNRQLVVNTADNERLKRICKGGNNVVLFVEVHK